MNKLVIPTSFELARQRVDVSSKHCFDTEGRVGFSSSCECKITIADTYINSDGKNTEIADISKINTFYHELAHMMLNTIGSDLTENESFVTCLGNMMMEFDMTRDKLPVAECIDIKKELEKIGKEPLRPFPKSLYDGKTPRSFPPIGTFPLAVMSTDNPDIKKFYMYGNEYIIHVNELARCGLDRNGKPFENNLAKCNNGTAKACTESANGEAYISTGESDTGRGNDDGCVYTANE
jgi:hypothetical protein